MTEKQQIKADKLSLRDKIPPDTIKTLSDRIICKVLCNAYVVASESVFTFLSVGSEVRTGELIPALRDRGKKVYVPKLAGGEIYAVRLLAESRLVAGAYGIWEPENGEDRLSVPDVCVVPGVAFDRFGGRAGYGKGYYDAFLRGKKTFKLAVCFDAQLTERVPVYAHDVRMDCIITEKREINIRRPDENLYPGVSG